MRIRTTFAAVVLLAMGSAPLLAATPDAETIVREGNGKGAAPCIACHGADGAGQAAAGFPRLAGLNAAYMRRQMDDFANGTRQSAVMTPLAKALTDAERQALAEYYAKLPIPESVASASPAPAASTPSADADLGQWLATRGRWDKQVPGCVQCHGPHGVGVGEHFPPLAGQPAKYIADQLQAWKQGSRHNDPLDLMKHVASALDDQDIKAVSAWFAAQPATLEGGAP